MGAVRIVQPRRLPGEVPWSPPFQYECSNGHTIAASKPCGRCPVVFLGTDCDGTLTRFGKGARS